MVNTLSVDIRLDGIEINGRLYSYPLLLTDLDALFEEKVWQLPGSGKARTSAQWIWEDSGVTAKTTDGVHALTVVFTVDGPEHDVRIEGQPYGVEFPPTGPTYPNRDFGKGYVMARRSDPGPDQRVKAILIEQKFRKAAKKEAAPKKPIESAAVDSAEFVDLNFKLLVIQVLMYDKRLLTPAFDVHRFAAEHTDRDIDIDEEGYDPIPEVLAHFAALPIPKALLGEVDEIYADGGNQIYMQIAPFWSGEDSVFDVADYSDVALLPNLKSMTLVGVDEATLESLRERGIEADLL